MLGESCYYIKKKPLADLLAYVLWLLHDYISNEAYYQDLGTDMSAHSDRVLQGEK